MKQCVRNWGRRNQSRHATVVLEDVPDGCSATGLRYISKIVVDPEFPVEVGTNPNFFQTFSKNPMNVKGGPLVHFLLGCDSNTNTHVSRVKIN